MQISLFDISESIKLYSMSVKNEKENQKIKPFVIYYAPFLFYLLEALRIF